MKLRFSGRRLEWVVRAACVSSLAALALIVWSLLDPSPIAVIVAMSAGQALGTASLGLFALAILADLRRAHVLDTSDETAAARARGEIPPASLPGREAAASTSQPASMPTSDPGGAREDEPER